MNPGAGAMGDMWPPTGVQQVCLVLSPRAAEAVADALTEQRANLAPEWISGTPDLMLILNPKEAPTVEPITTTPDAPYGHKADGSPRKRPAPTAATLAKASATRAAKANGRSPEPKSRFLERMIGELDTEIATLTEARDVLLAVAA
jgi:hypothetical protein